MSELFILSGDKKREYVFLKQDGLKPALWQNACPKFFTLKGGIKSETDCKIKTHVPSFSP